MKSGASEEEKQNKNQQYQKRAKKQQQVQSIEQAVSKAMSKMNRAYLDAPQYSKLVTQDTKAYSSKLRGEGAQGHALIGPGKRSGANPELQKFYDTLHAQPRFSQKQLAEILPRLYYKESAEIKWLRSLFSPFSVSTSRIPQTIPVQTATAYHREQLTFTVGTSGKAYMWLWYLASNSTCMMVIDDAPAEQLSPSSSTFGDAVEFFAAGQASGKLSHGSYPLPVKQFSAARVTSGGFKLTTQSNITQSAGNVQILYSRLPYMPNLPLSSGMYADQRCYSVPVNSLQIEGGVKGYYLPATVNQMKMFADTDMNLLQDWGEEKLNLVAEDSQDPTPVYRISAAPGAFNFSGNENDIDLSSLYRTQQVLLAFTGCANVTFRMEVAINYEGYPRRAITGIAPMKSAMGRTDPSNVIKAIPERALIKPGNTAEPAKATTKAEEDSTWLGTLGHAAFDAAGGVAGALVGKSATGAAIGAEAADSAWDWLFSD